MVFFQLNIKIVILLQSKWKKTYTLRVLKYHINRIINVYLYNASIITIICGSPAYLA
jgi:hypothetical protein